MDNTAFVSWVVSHLAFIGWPVFFTVSYKLMRFIFKAGRTLIVVEQRVLKAEETIYLMANNHLAHIQQAVEETNKHLTSIGKNLELALIRRGDDED